MTTRIVVLLQALTIAPKNLTQHLHQTTLSELHHRPQPDQWSIADVLNHLIYVEARYRARLARVIQEDNPLLPAIWPDETSHSPHLSLADLLTEFEKARAETIEFLTGLPVTAWERPARHETKGKTDFYAMVLNLIDHDSEHLNQLSEILQQGGESGQAVDRQPSQNHTTAK